MEFINSEIKGIIIISLKPNIDNRGFFVRTYDNNVFNENGLKFDWVQENHSKTVKIGTIRGLHFQFPPFAETKLVRCIRGKILDVFVDLRKNSPTFGKWDSVILSENNYKMVLIPRGFAHGFLTLTDECEVLYKVDNYYNPEYECGIIWDDKILNIEWGITNPILSEKDKKNISFSEFVEKYGGIDI
jgi:dTDP-4-dehydrorhamnose 3,5-epimerase